MKISLPKRLEKLTFKQKQIIIGVGAAVILVVMGAILMAMAKETGAYMVKDDFTGKTINEAAKLAEENGIKWEIWWTNEYKPGAEDEQTVTYVGGVLKENGEPDYSFNRYISDDYKIRKGMTVKFITEHRTKAQEKAIKKCEAKTGYTYKFENGDVKCQKLQKTLCEEAGKVWYKNSYCKTQEEIDAEEKAEEKKKKEEAESKATEEKQEAEKKEASQETEKSSAETQAETQTQEQVTTKQDNGEELPSDISPYEIKALCERGFEARGYTNAKINMTNQYAMSYPPYIYVIVGTLSTKAGFTSSRQQVGVVQCQANWSTWTVKSLTVNGTQL